MSKAAPGVEWFSCKNGWDVCFSGIGSHQSLGQKLQDTLYLSWFSPHMSLWDSVFLSEAVQTRKHKSDSDHECFFLLSRNTSSPSLQMNPTLSSTGGRKNISTHSSYQHLGCCLHGETRQHVKRMRVRGRKAFLSHWLNTSVSFLSCAPPAPKVELLCYL